MAWRLAGALLSAEELRLPGLSELECKQFQAEMPTAQCLAEPVRDPDLKRYYICSYGGVCWWTPWAKQVSPD